MKEFYLDWIENHKGERENGKWFVLDCDVLGEVEFDTEKELDDFLWNYVTDCR